MASTSPLERYNKLSKPLKTLVDQYISSLLTCFGQEYPEARVSFSAFKMHFIAQICAGEGLKILTDAYPKGRVLKKDKPADLFKPFPYIETNKEKNSKPQTPPTLLSDNTPKPPPADSKTADDFMPDWTEVEKILGLGGVARVRGVMDKKKGREK